MNAMFVMTFVCLNCGVETMLFPGELPSRPQQIASWKIAHQSITTQKIAPSEFPPPP